VGSRIEALPRPFAAVATDLRSGAEVVLREGDVLEAIRASVAIPGLFTPQRWRGRLLVDGGLANPLPVDVARQLGADFVIAVSVLKLHDDSMPRTVEHHRLTTQLLARFLAGYQVPQAAGAGEPPPHPDDDAEDDIGLIEVLSKAAGVIQARIAAGRLREQPPNCFIAVPVQEIGVFDFHCAAEVVEAGRAAAREALPEIQSALLAAAPLSEKVTRWIDAATARVSRSADSAASEADPGEET
jgi:NTE family protein